MKTKCLDCGKEFDDVNYERFGSPNSIRTWCNECVDKRLKDKKINKR